MKRLEDMEVYEESADIDSPINFQLQEYYPERLIDPQLQVNNNNNNDNNDDDIEEDEDDLEADEDEEEEEEQEEEEQEEEKPETLHEAVRNGNAAAIQKIISLKKPELLNEKNKQGDTALHLAVHYKKTGIFWQLLEGGADPSLTNKQGKRPLFKPSLHLEWAKQLWALRNNEKIPARNYILSACFEILAPSYLIDMSHSNQRDLLELIQNATPKQMQNFLSKNLSRHAFTPLMWIPHQKKEYLDVTKILLNHATEEMLTKKNTYGNSFIKLIIEKGHSNILEYTRSCFNGKFAKLLPPVPAHMALPPKPKANAVNALEQDGAKLRQDLLKTENDFQRISAQIAARKIVIESHNKAIAQDTQILGQLTEKIAYQKKSILTHDETRKEAEKEALRKDIEQARHVMEKYRQYEQALSQRLMHLEQPPTANPLLPSMGTKRTAQEAELDNNNGNNNNNNLAFQSSI